MTREEAIRWLTNEKWKNANNKYKKEWNEAFDLAIEALQEVQKHEETFEWCTDCKEYDKDNYCCHRWSKMIRNTVEELKEYSGLVRCKDCRHRDLFSCPLADNDFQKDDDYCSWGERR